MPEPVWTFLRRGKCVTSAGNRTPYCSANSAATVTTVLTRLLIQTILIFNLLFKLWRKTHQTTVSLTQATVTVGILRIFVETPHQHQ